MTTRGIVSPVHRSVPVDRDVALRLGRFIFRVGEREAARRLGVGKMTLAAAREHGGMMRATYERLVAALERCEAEDAQLEVGT